MRRSSEGTWLVAVAVTAAVIAAVAWVVVPRGPALAEAGLAAEEITPNADGLGDVTRITYRLIRPATVSIYFLDATGTQFDFRREGRRGSGEFQVDFGGVVDGYRLPGDTLEGEILARVLPDGDYAWVIEAREDDGQEHTLRGSLRVRQADTALPVLENLTVAPPVFAPNQDGLDDRVRIQVGLAKDVAEDGLRMELLSRDDPTVTRPIAESVLSVREPGQAGVHEYDYDGGIDLGEQPPPDGPYLVRATAEDRVGQRVQVTRPLTIVNGGYPRAEIVLADVEFSAKTIIEGTTLVFTLTVQNYGVAPIRTTGPEPGYGYASMDQNYNATGFYQESGAFRIGIMCDTCQNDFPWRWAIGSRADLTLIPDSLGRPQYYLMPGQRSVVTGAIALDRIVTSRNPQYFWAGLIHEEVNVYNNRSGLELIQIDPR
jgi:hypothetical protein